jgi:hypothetical protein
LNAEAGNTIEATTILGASSIDSWRYGVSIDYELLRRLIVSASILAIDENFEGLSRQDRIRRSGLSARFMLNRYLYAFVGYNFESQESQPPDFGVDNYELNTYFIRLQGQL